MQLTLRPAHGSPATAACASRLLPRYGSLGILPSLLFCAAAASAQVPPGWAVVGTSKNNPSAFTPGSGGLYLVDPDEPRLPIAVGPLSCELTGACGSPSSGVTGVLIDPDGTLLVGEFAPEGQMVDLHRITLAGAQVVGDVKFPIGSPAGVGGSVRPLGIYPNGDVLIATANCLPQPDPARNALWGILRPSTGQKVGLVHPVLLGIQGSIPSPRLNAVYFTQFYGLGSRLYRLSVPEGGQPVLIASLPDLAKPQLIDADGFILATDPAASPARIYRIDPVSGNFTQSTAQLGLVSVAEQRVSGDLLVGALDGPPSHIYRVTPEGNAILVSAGPLGGWGNLQSIATVDSRAHFRRLAPLPF